MRTIPVENDIKYTVIRYSAGGITIQPYKIDEYTGDMLTFGFFPKNTNNTSFGFYRDEWHYFATQDFVNDKITETINTSY